MSWALGSVATIGDHAEDPSSSLTSDVRPPNMSHDRVVWITGASAGIGKALVEALPWKNTLVIGVSRSGLGEAIAPDDSVELRSLRADLSEPAGWDAVEASFTEHLRPGLAGAVLIHAAADVGPVGFAGEVDSVAYRSAVLLNTVSPPVLGEAFVRAAATANVPAQVLMLTSGPSVYEGWSAYKAGKVEMNEWTETTGRRLAADNADCRVLAVAPGLVETGMQTILRDTDPADFPAKEKFVEANRTGQTRPPAEVADKLWKVLQEDAAANGAVLDLRDLA
jgi:benzil reductase ((S)-benzoin forming)